MDHDWQGLKDSTTSEPSEALKSKIMAQYSSEKKRQHYLLDRVRLFISPLIGRGWVLPTALAASISFSVIGIGGGLWFLDQNNPKSQLVDTLAQEQTIEEMEFILGL